VELTYLVALLTFAAAGSGSPGPNNSLLLASGVRFGFRRTVPHVAGTAIGIGGLVVAVAAGLGVLLEVVPAAELVLRIAGSVYLLILAFRLALGHAVERSSTTAPLTVRQAAAFQWVNPKGWVFAVALASAFLPPGLPAAVGGLVVAAILAVVVIATASVWALGGAGLSRLLGEGRSHRGVSVVLAVLMVASVAFLWL
jgi:threonine/homoserine/homoserine lactone efflux protein